MLVYYALGGGLGHLVRARAFLHTLGLETEATLFTSSRFADDHRVTGGLPVVRVPDSLNGDRAGLRALRTLAQTRVPLHRCQSCMAQPYIVRPVP